jgi:hypothetical protein
MYSAFRAEPSRIITDGVQKQASVNTVMNREVKNSKYFKNV